MEKKTQTLVRLSGAGRQSIESYWRDLEQIRGSAARWPAQNAVPVLP